MRCLNHTAGVISRCLAFVWLAACVPNLAVDATKPVRCEISAHCPNRMVCERALCVLHADAAAPSLLSVVPQDTEQIALTFSEAIVDGWSISFTPALTVTSAVLAHDGLHALVVVSDMQRDVAYTAHVEGAVDVVGNAAEPLSATFIGLGVAPDPSAPMLLAPADGAIARTGSVSLRWTPRAGAFSYHWRVARDAAFTDLVVEGDSAQAQVSVPLTEALTVYWDVASSLSGVSAPFSFDLLGDRVYVFCATAPCDATGAIGNFSKPLTTIAEGLATASAWHIGQVDVGGGAYAETIIARDGIDVGGGYDRTFSEAGRSGKTRIDAVLAVSAIGVGTPARLERLDLRGVVQLSRSAVTLRQCDVSAPGTAVTIDAGPQAPAHLDMVTVHSGNGTGATAAVKVAGLGIVLGLPNVVIENSQIFNDNTTCTTTSAAVSVTRANVNVSQSTLQGGQCGSRSIALEMDTAGGLVTRNTLRGGSSGASCGVTSSLDLTGGAKNADRFLLINNVIGGTAPSGTAATYRALALTADDSALFNTIVVGARGEADTSFGFYAAGSTPIATTFVNNVIVGENAATATCMYFDTSETFVRAWANVLVGCAVKPLVHINACTPCATPCAGNATASCAVSEAEVNTELGAPTGTHANKTIADPSSVGFVDYPDDLHLLSTVVPPLLAGALTAPADTKCDLFGCGVVSDDRDGTPAHRQSIGAYEAP